MVSLSESWVVRQVKGTSKGCFRLQHVCTGPCFPHHPNNILVSSPGLEKQEISVRAEDEAVSVAHDGAFPPSSPGISLPSLRPVSNLY